MYSLYKVKALSKQLVKSKLFPGVTIGMEYRYRQEIPGSDKGEDFISLRASTPIPIFYNTKEKRLIKASTFKIKELKAMVNKIAKDLQSDYKGERKNYSKLLQVFKNYNTLILPSYNAVYQSQMASLATGTVRLIDVLDSYQTFLKATLERAAIFRDLMISRQKLLYLLNRQTVKGEMK